MNFDENIAVELGVECAILLSNIQFWVKKNRANGEEKHFQEGRWWTYNSAGSFVELFPYWKERSIYNYLKKLEDAGYIKSGNFNKHKYDRTKWYTTDGCKNSIYKVKELEVPIPVSPSAKKVIPSTQNGEPIPDITTDNKPDINSYVSDWQAVVLYFYEKISPETPSKLRFRKGTKETALHLLSLHPLDEIKLKIDALAGSPDKKYMMNLTAFSNRYSTIKLIFPSTGIKLPKLITGDAELDSY